MVRERIILLRSERQVVDGLRGMVEAVSSRVRCDMKIDTITLRELRMPLKHFFETSFGRAESRRILLVTADCEGVAGWAECVAGDGPFFSYEWIETAWATIRQFLAPALLSATFDTARDGRAFMSGIRGHHMAKAALENALWDAEAQQKQNPL